MKRLFKKTGFTIVELVIVIAVIAVLAAVLIPTFSSVIDKANESAALQEATNAYKEYVVENAATGKILDDLYVEVDNGYIHYQNGEAVKADNGKYVVTEIPDEAYVVPYTLAVFSFGENGEASHKDGEEITDPNGYTYVEDNYLVTLTNCNKVFKGATDNKGNSCIKLGSNSHYGSFQLEVPEEVNAVTFYISGYKDNSAVVSIETKSKNFALLTKDLLDTTYNIATISNNGQYTAVTIDTTTNKIINFSTLDASKRCMINTIKYLKNLPGNNNESEEDGLVSATINFDDKSKRIVFDPTQQVWLENNIIVKNSKGDGGTYVEDTSNPAKFYKNSSLLITTKNKDLISKLDIRCTDSDHANNLASVLGSDAAVTGTLVKVTLDSKTDIFEMVLSSGLAYVSSITIYYEVNENFIDTCNHENTLVDVAATDVKCENDGYSKGQYCSNCYDVTETQTTIPATGHNFIDGECVCGEVDQSLYSITFDDVENRTSFSDTQQVWEKNGITVTNNKTQGSTAISSECNPVKFYAKSELIISATNQFAKIVVNCNTNSYATNLVNSVDRNIGISQAEGKKVTITLYEKVNSFTIIINSQVRVDSIIIDYDSLPHIHTEEVIPGFDATCTESGLTDGVKCSVCEAIIVTQEEISAKGHNYVDGACSVCEVKEPENTTVSVSIADYAATNSWANSIQYSTINLDENVIVTATGGGNSGKYYTNGNNWRLYQNEKPELTIFCPNGVIENVRITYTIDNSGVLLFNNSAVSSATLVEVKASSISFNIGNTSDNVTNGQVRITSIEVTYGVNNENNNQNDSCDHIEEVLAAKEATCTETGLTEGKKCSVCGKITVAQEEVAANGHSFSEGKCTVCGVVDPNYAVVQPDTPAEPKVLATFDLGANGSASHNDGSSKTTYTETYGDYTLSITGGSSFYTGARDAQGNSCIKLGTSSKVGTFTFTVPEDVTKVVILLAKYKTNTAKITVNGTTYTLNKNSNDGEYDEIEVDTSINKTVDFTTVSGGYRCMINSIAYIGIEG